MKTTIDPSYYICNASLSMDRVKREVRQFEMMQRMDQYGLPNDSRFGLDVETFMDHAAQQMILRMKARIASKKFDVKTVRFPDGAWQFVKHNIQKSSWMMYKFVRDWIANNPVRYIEITMEANAYHPDIAIPDQATYVDIAVSARKLGY